MKNDKTPRIGGIQAELLNSGGKEMIKRLTKSCNQVWEKREVPSDWKDRIIITIPKKVILKIAITGEGIEHCYQFLGK